MWPANLILNTHAKRKKPVISVYLWGDCLCYQICVLWIQVFTKIICTFVNLITKVTVIISPCNVFFMILFLIRISYTNQTIFFRKCMNKHSSCHVNLQILSTSCNFIPTFVCVDHGHTCKRVIVFFFLLFVFHQNVI